MTYKLLIGQKSYSSWSLRGWLCFAPFDIPVDVTRTLIYGDRFAADVAEFGGQGTVPVAVTPEGGRLTDSLAIAWHLAERFPEKGLLPEAAKPRSEAMSMIAEMHAGFAALRSACPMNLRTAWEGFEPSDAVSQDCARADAIWSAALAASGGPFLFGRFTLADAFYAPLASRFLSYKLPMSTASRAYADALFRLPEIVAWREDGLAVDDEVAFYDMAPLKRSPFPIG